MKKFTEDDVKKILELFKGDAWTSPVVVAESPYVGDTLLEKDSNTTAEVVEMLTSFAEVLRRIENAKNVEMGFVKNGNVSNISSEMTLGESSSRAIGILDYVANVDD